MKAPELKNKDAYRDAGVDIEAGDALVERIKPHVRKTRRTGIMEDIGGFGALFDLGACGYKDPVLVSSTDGVGTKLRIAIDTGRHSTIGQDLVAMCVNDLIVQGAEPLFFLDYFATGRLDVDIAEEVIAGIARACQTAGCALIGGETAEMPGHYAQEDYDLAGFTVGAVERSGIINGVSVKPGDIILGIASSGPHSNGYSLIRRIVSGQGLTFDSPAPFARELQLGEVLLEPTKLYVKQILSALRKPIAIKALAHITGGGLLENIPRVLPENTIAVIDAEKWVLPPVFEWLARSGGLGAHELARTLNCGIGMVAVCDPDSSGHLISHLESCGESGFVIGTIEAAIGLPRVELVNTTRSWPVAT